MDFRSSVSWFDSDSQKRKFRAIPFVSKSGKFSLSTLYIWKCHPQQMIFSLISTVYSRILSLLRKRHKFKTSKRLLNCAFKISIVYTITRHSWVLDRFLGMTRASARTPIKAVEGFTTSCVYALSTNKRFVYSQAYFQANWLKFQVFRPSDKLSKEVRMGSHLSNLHLRLGSHSNDDWIRAEFHSSVYDLWEIDLFIRTIAKTHYQGSSGFALSVSELDSYKGPEEFNFSSSDDEDY